MRVVLMVMSLVVFLSAEFSRSAGTVQDSFTGLEWQDDYSNNSGEIKKATWSQALIYCDELILGGYSSWRLPNRNELKSIVDRGKYNPAISSIFQNFTSNYYWSSTTFASDSSYAWVVDFDYGYDFWDGKAYEDYVRCVRGGQ